MRLFTGMDLPPAIIAALEDLVRRLRPSARLKWSPLENLHITTKFIGEWPEERLSELKATLSALPKRGAIPIRLRTLGFFPDARRPRVFWAGVEAGPELAALAEQTEQALARLGIPVEQRPFSPHLTLARLKEPVPMQGLHEAIARLPGTEFGGFTAERFFLYRSRLGPGGSVYTKLAEFPFEVADHGPGAPLVG